MPEIEKLKKERTVTETRKWQWYRSQK